MTPSPRLQSPSTRVIQSERSPSYSLNRLLPLYPFAAGRIMDMRPVVFQREHPRLIEVSNFRCCHRGDLHSQVVLPKNDSRVHRQGARHYIGKEKPGVRNLRHDLLEASPLEVLSQRTPPSFSSSPARMDVGHYPLVVASSTEVAHPLHHRTLRQYDLHTQNPFASEAQRPFYSPARTFGGRLPVTTFLVFYPLLSASSYRSLTTSFSPFPYFFPQILEYTVSSCLCRNTKVN